MVYQTKEVEVSGTRNKHVYNGFSAVLKSILNYIFQEINFKILSWIQSVHYKE